MPIAPVFPKGGGGSPIINVVEADTIGVIDFSVLPNTSFNSDGDYVIPIQQGKFVNEATITSKYTENLFGIGKQEIVDGKLQLLSGGVSSLFGFDYWSTNVAPCGGR